MHGNSLELLLELVCELVGSSRAATLVPLSRDLYVRHSGNLRECLRSLYDVHGQSSAQAG